jgi:hypothetical protein
MLCILWFLSSCCSETEVSEQLYYSSYNGGTWYTVIFPLVHSTTAQSYYNTTTDNLELSVPPYYLKGFYRLQDVTGTDKTATYGIPAAITGPPEIRFTVP